MNTCYSGRSSRPARLFSFDLLDGPQGRLCRPHLREATAGLRAQPLRDGIHKESGLESTRMAKGVARCGSFQQGPRSGLRRRVGGLSDHEYATHNRMEAALIGIAARRKSRDRIAAVGRYGA